MKKYLPFISFGLVNSVLIYLASVLAPNDFILGTYRLDPMGAALISGFAVAVVVWFAMPLLGKSGLKKLGGKEKVFLFYWLVNSLAIWLITRLPVAFGFGISAFYWAFILGLALNFAQWMVWMGFDKK